MSFHATTTHTARKAEKMACSVFIGRHQIFPTNVETSERSLTLEEMLAQQMAASAVQGDGWKRPAARLADSFLLT